MKRQLVGARLLESGGRERRSGGAVALSTLAHGALIAASVSATLHPPVRHHRIESTRVTFAQLSRPRPQPSEPQATSSPRARLRGFQLLVAPIDIPTVLPSIDLAVPVTMAEDYSGMGIAGGFANGVSLVAAVSRAATSSDLPDDRDVDEPPYLLPGQMGPDYPNDLRGAAIDGLVVVRFVVDTLGKVETRSLRVLQATHPLFVASVRDAMGRLRFLPASLSGKRVRVRMEQRFEFHLASR